jgi:hypothetical protein
MIRPQWQELREIVMISHSAAAGVSVTMVTNNSNKTVTAYTC